MKLQISAIALIAGLGLAGMATAQDAPVGGPTAKGNAPLKSTHPVNNGAAKQGANSFTQNEARKHIMNSGYTSVSGLAKGKDGVWRGTAMRGQTTYNVALDYKGNVTDGGAVDANATSSKSSASAMSGTSSTTMPASTTTGSDKAVTSSTSTTSMGMTHHHRWMRHHHWRHHMKPCHVQGAACSGADRNHDGIADKDEHKTH